MSEKFSVTPASWETDRDQLMAVRTEVFVIEQNVPAEIEIDDSDKISFHVLAIESKTEKPIGTARLLPEGRIGRVAVLKNWRKRGVGAALMTALIDEAKSRDELAELMLHAQTWTIGFYESLGFIAEGPEFDEADIPHRTMRLRLRRA